ncbi:MAG: hypothetical protein WEC15_04585 [Flavobacteriales bacterium]
MNPTLRNVLAVLTGIIVCMMVNGVLIAVSASVIPPPEGVDPNDMESIKANADKFLPEHFLFPFLAHALGSLVGAFVAVLLSASRAMSLAVIVGGVHLLGGIAAAFMIPAPTWFVVADLALAYLPMAWIGGRLAIVAVR